MSSPYRNNGGMDRKLPARRSKREKSRATQEENTTSARKAVTSSPDQVANAPASIARKPSPFSNASVPFSLKKVSTLASVAALAPPPPAAAPPPLCRFFVLRGFCKFGDDCMYSHTLPPGGILEARRQIPCPFYLKGTCRFGDHCELRHDSQDVEHRAAQEKTQEQYTCGICLEPLGREHNKRFGLLEGCEHVYCLDCLRTWRKEGSREAQDRRVCPTCRTKSFYVIPSWNYSVGEEKKQVASGYKAKLAKLPCQRFDGTLGSCPFGSDCFYAHLQNGKNVKSQDQTMEEIHAEREGRRRHTHEMDDLEIIHTFLMLLELSRDLHEWDDDMNSDWDDDDDDSEGEW